MIIDSHCDVLLKLWEDPKRSFYNSPDLRVNYKKWMDNSVKVQCFAIFVPDYVPSSEQYSVALEMVDLFYERIINPYQNIKLITCQQDILDLTPNETGALLTLEGCHPIGEELVKLKTLIRLGVRAVGLTWNQANAVCDGIGEERGAGLSSFGVKVVHELNKQRIWTDLSHISYKGFWDTMKIAKFPMASHSNAYTLTPHRRNLDDLQLKELIRRNAYIGITYVADFLSVDGEASVDDVIEHILYVLSLGGEYSVGLGSDFDGTESIIKHLYDYQDYDSFAQLLKRTLSPSIFSKVTHGNFIDAFSRI
ncbi:dipeptidase [Pontibacillus yanchengensis]|uniref:Diguanylate cyclase n=1 Tax=Pontibacillus yanchengensis Y32 TaxID=1385514 RepID=A0A0A2TGG3_9BACI|nr:dipeptidase [Pontibacillus yanchengensis]KGP73518.1 diguanylate cyclase [Pontibacillus yanchengensis Y32]